ncbi:MAG: hypothetical protein KDK54_20500 [Leptospiraceae bacterium]|nr:hypothetical protein [Leptospiraceae bacterium]
MFFAEYDTCAIREISPNYLGTISGSSDDNIAKCGFVDGSFGIGLHGEIHGAIYDEKKKLIYSAEIGIDDSLLTGSHRFSDDQVIRKFDLDSNILSTLLHGVYTPNRMSNGLNDVFILTTGSNVSKYDPMNNLVSIIAGQEFEQGNLDGNCQNASFTVPGNAIQDPKTGDIYVSGGFHNPTIRKIRKSDCSVTTIAGSTDSAGYKDGTGLNARFKEPQGLALYKGNLYISDSGNRLIRKLEIVTNNVSTYLGKYGDNRSVDGDIEIARLFGPNQISIYNNILYIHDYYEIRMIRLD